MWGEEILRETIIYNKDIKAVDFKDKKTMVIVRYGEQEEVKNADQNRTIMN